MFATALTPEWIRTISTVFVGSALSVIVALILHLATKRDMYRRVVFTERIKAVRDLLEHARQVKDASVIAHARRNSGTATSAAREVEEAKERLWQRSLYHEIWSSSDTLVRSVKKFNAAVDP